MRKLRYLQPGATYKTSSLITRHEPYLGMPANQALFDKILQRALVIFAFTLIKREIHPYKIVLILKPKGDANLSNIMKWILQTYAINFNRRNGFKGHFWGDRFASWILDEGQIAIDSMVKETDNFIQGIAYSLKQAWYKILRTLRAKPLTVEG